jgi:hypothetical protein
MGVRTPLAMTTSFITILLLLQLWIKETSLEMHASSGDVDAKSDFRADYTLSCRKIQRPYMMGCRDAGTRRF